MKGGLECFIPLLNIILIMGRNCVLNNWNHQSPKPHNE